MSLLIVPATELLLTISLVVGCSLKDDGVLRRVSALQGRGSN
jgi:hypothetical protein